jgi:biotin carboxyl carrier protein
MTFEVDINGRTRRVSIDAVGAAGAAGGRFHVLVDGVAHDVDARTTDLGLSLMFGDGRSVDAAVTERAAAEWFVQLPHVGVSAFVDRRRAETGRAADASRPGEQRVAAPMPGRVVRVLVKPGDEVALRQGLVVVEAMKMENELVSPKAGRIKDVAVTEGASVEAGRLLIVVE